MKKFLSVVLILTAAVLLWSFSFQAGVRHAIEDSEIWTVDCGLGAARGPHPLA